jgi:hypothetical protein
MLRISPLVFALLLPLAGCGQYQPAPMPKAPPGPQTNVAAKPAPAPAPAAASQPQQSGMTAGMTAVGTAVGMAPLETAVQGPMGVAPAGQPAQSSPPGGRPGAAYQKAEVGVGAKGRGYAPGLITTPVAVYFAARERIVFEIQVPEAMKLYKATNGNAPKSQEEFMQRIVKENQIRLPELPQGSRYLYDPATEQLLVEHPAR